MLMDLIDENREMRKTVQQMIPKMGHTTNINTVNNQSYNINLFLNEQCKNAMSLNDFIGSLQINNGHIENIGKKGFVESMSQLIIKGLENMNVCERPIHCADIDKSLMYVHDDNNWVKDENKVLITDVINQTGKKNLQAINNLVDSNDETDKYWDILGETITCDNDEKDIKYNTVIKNIAKHTFLSPEQLKDYKK